jgi:hypothetical protein
VGDEPIHERLTQVKIFCQNGANAGRGDSVESSRMTPDVGALSTSRGTLMAQQKRLGQGPAHGMDGFALRNRTHPDSSDVPRVTACVGVWHSHRTQFAFQGVGIELMTMLSQLHLITGHYRTSHAFHHPPLVQSRDRSYTNHIPPTTAVREQTQTARPS